jgi:hypothetical protein
MESNQIKQEIRAYINRADERFLRLIYSMVESEKTEWSFFDTTIEAMTERAKKSLKSVENGNTRSIHEFKNDIESWIKNRAIQ